MLRMRWKVVFYNTPNNEKPLKSTNYGLKTNYCSTQVKKLVPFENDVMQLAKDIKFHRTINNFQKKMKEDIQNIRSSEKTVTAADKTSNMYRLTDFFAMDRL